MRTTPRFVTPSDYENYKGENLLRILKINDNSSNKADLFLMQVEDLLLARIDATSFRLNDWNDLTEFQLESLQKAIIIQADYIIRNSNLFTDSGYDLEKGLIIDPDVLAKITLCNSAVDFLRNCGLYNHVIQNKGRYGIYF